MELNSGLPIPTYGQYFNSAEKMFSESSIYRVFTRLVNECGISLMKGGSCTFAIKTRNIGRNAGYMDYRIVEKSIEKLEELGLLIYNKPTKEVTINLGYYISLLLKFEEIGSSNEKEFIDDFKSGVNMFTKYDLAPMSAEDAEKILIIIKGGKKEGIYSPLSKSTQKRVNLLPQEKKCVNLLTLDDEEKSKFTPPATQKEVNLLPSEDKMSKFTPPNNQKRVNLLPSEEKCVNLLTLEDKNEYIYSKVSKFTLFVENNEIKSEYIYSFLEALLSKNTHFDFNSTLEAMNYALSKHIDFDGEASASSIASLLILKALEKMSKFTHMGSIFTHLGSKFTHEGEYIYSSGGVNLRTLNIKKEKERKKLNEDERSEYSLIRGEKEKQEEEGLIGEETEELNDKLPVEDLKDSEGLEVEDNKDNKLPDYDNNIEDNIEDDEEDENNFEDNEDIQEQDNKFPVEDKQDFLEDEDEDTYIPVQEEEYDEEEEAERRARRIAKYHSKEYQDFKAKVHAAGLNKIGSNIYQNKPFFSLDTAKWIYECMEPEELACFPDYIFLHYVMRGLALEYSEKRKTTQFDYNTGEEVEVEYDNIIRFEDIKTFPVDPDIFEDILKSSYEDMLGAVHKGIFETTTLSGTPISVSTNIEEGADTDFKYGSMFKLNPYTFEGDLQFILNMAEIYNIFEESVDIKPLPVSKEEKREETRKSVKMINELMTIDEDKLTPIEQVMKSFIKKHVEFDADRPWRFFEHYSSVIPADDTHPEPEIIHGTDYSMEIHKGTYFADVYRQCEKLGIKQLDFYRTLEKFEDREGIYFPETIKFGKTVFSYTKTANVNARLGYKSQIAQN